VFAYTGRVGFSFFAMRVTDGNVASDASERLEAFIWALCIASE
jgi:hypothetical protein